MYVCVTINSIYKWLQQLKVFDFAGECPPRALPCHWSRGARQGSFQNIASEEYDNKFPSGFEVTAV